MGVPKRHPSRDSRHNLVRTGFSDFNLAGRTALVTGAESDTLRVVASVLWDSGAHVFASDAPFASLLEAPPPTPGGVDILVHCSNEPEQTAALARCLVAPHRQGAVIMLRTTAPQPPALVKFRRAARELADLHIRLNVVRVPSRADSALSAALGAVVFLAQRRHLS